MSFKQYITEDTVDLKDLPDDKLKSLKSFVKIMSGSLDIKDAKVTKTGKGYIADFPYAKNKKYGGKSLVLDKDDLGTLNKIKDFRYIEHHTLTNIVTMAF